MSLKSGVILYREKPREAPVIGEKAKPLAHETSNLPIYFLVLILSSSLAVRYLPLSDEAEEELSYISISELEGRFHQSSDPENVTLASKELPPSLHQRRPVVIENSAKVHEPSKFVRAFESPQSSSSITKVAPSVSQLKAKVSSIISAHGKKGVDIEDLSKRIVLESIRQKYDPLFVAAVIKSESAFNKFATSHVGAKGLMQIMPATGKFIEELRGFENVIGSKLTDPGYNVKLGITYLKHLDELFDGNRVFTLTAYNWGPGRMEDAFNGKRKIPKEVVNYALKILGDQEKWRHELLREVRRELS